jgi:hypothetical protein
MAVAFCEQLGAKELILTHFSQRYKRPDDTLEPGDVTTDKLVSEARDAIKDLTGHSLSSSSSNSMAVGGSDQCDYAVSAADDFKTYTIHARKQ